MAEEGDRGINFSSGSPFSTFVKVDPAQVGDRVTLYNLSNGDRLAVPALDFVLDGRVWVTPSFDFAGFDFNIPFDFELIPLDIGLVPTYTIRHLTDDYIIDDIKGNWTIDALIGKYIYIIAGTNAGNYYQIIDNGDNWLSINRPPANFLFNANCTETPITAFWAYVDTRGAEFGCLPTGGVFSGYAYVKSNKWEYDHSLWFGIGGYPWTLGGDISFYAKFESEVGETSYNCLVAYNWVANPQTYGYIVLTNNWKKFTIPNIRKGIGCYLLVPRDGKWRKISMCGFYTGAEMTLSEMGFAVGNLFVIVDSIP